VTGPSTTPPAAPPPEPLNPPAGAAPPTPASPVAAPGALPMPVFVEFLRRLHSGPPQSAAAVRVAMALWQQAAGRGDAAQAHEALRLAREELDRLIGELTHLQETGRRWSGQPSPSHTELAAAAEAAARWERELSGSVPKERGETSNAASTGYSSAGDAPEDT